MLDEDIIRTATQLAEASGIEAAALLAVIEVESAGIALVRIDERDEPVIRFEGHYFDRRLSAALRQQARSAGLSSPTPGKIANPRSQSERWATFRRAAAIDRKAACESVSWGLGQVMGAHWAWLGYASVDELVAEARSGTVGQLRLLIRYIEKAGLLEALRRRDWAGFARGYNGPLYARNRYDVRLANAYARHRTIAGGSKDQPSHLARGSRGEQVRSVQALLRSRGYALDVDGLFGPQTEIELRRFQTDCGLRADGIAGPATMAHLRGGLRVGGVLPNWLGAVLVRLRSMLGLS